MKTKELKDKIKEKPKGPGVYIFRDGEVPLYVGKAIDIQDRLRSYTDPRTTHIRNMVEKADNLEHRETEDEKEALLLEANLIKKYQPKYNIRLKDGKSYPVIQITEHEYPAIEATRDPDEDAVVFGPFTEMGRVENAIKAIRDLYGIRGCSDRKFSNRDRPCLDYQMGICSAPCVGYIEKDEYHKQVQKAKDFFQTDQNHLLNKIEKQMKEKAEEKNFERAKTLKEYRNDLQNLRGNKKLQETGIKHILAVGNNHSRIGFVLLEKNTIKDKRFYNLNENAENKIEALQAFIKQFYAKDSLPEAIVLEESIQDSQIKNWLEDEGISFGEPKDGRERILMDSAKDVAEKTVKTKMSKLGEILDLEINRVECFDVSHTGGKDVVGSNVVFENDKPVKSDYRRKKLEEKNDDYDNMYQLLKWRAQRQKKGRDKRPEPDALLIDGGQGQLKAAANALRDIGWSKPVFGIVKPDDKILGLHRNPEIPDDTSQILSEIRDEAHRFAINYHKNRRNKINPVLEQVKGLGPAKRKNLMKKFSLEELKTADKQKIANTDGIGLELAEKIKKKLN